MKRKFKAWDKRNNRWLTDHDTVYMDAEGDAYILVRGASSDYLSSQDVDIVFFTGILDKNKKEVYEGDRTRDGVIEFNVDTCCYIIRRSNKTFVRLEVKKGNIEVINNIYEMPF